MPTADCSPRSATPSSSPLVGAAAHVFVDDLEAPALATDDRHHVVRVLRLRPGEAVTVSDGQGSWRVCRFAAGGLVPAGDVTHEAPLSPPITIGFALTKGERPEWVIQKLTEVGVDHIVPFVTQRTVVRWDAERGERRMARLRAVAREAAMQSRRVRLPTVQDIASFGDVITRLGPSTALAQPGSAQTVSLQTPTVLIGPEGGFTADELACDLGAVDLGSGVLRAETAAVVCAVLLTALRTGLVRPAN